MLPELTRKILRKFDLILSVGKIEDTKEFMQATLDTYETVSEVPYFQHYGFSSSSPAETQAVFVSNGTRDSLVCLGEKGPDQNLDNGQTRIFSGTDAKITLDPSGKISIEGKNLELRIQGKNPILSLVSAIEELVMIPLLLSNGLTANIQPSSEFKAKIQEVKNCVA